MRISGHEIPQNNGTMTIASNYMSNIERNDADNNTSDRGEYHYYLTAIEFPIKLILYILQYVNTLRKEGELLCSAQNVKFERNKSIFRIH